MNYRRAKTGRLYSIKIHEKAQLIFDKYVSVESKYLFPILSKDQLDLNSQKSRIKGFIRNANRALVSIAKIVEIDKPISTYYARYTWANLAKDLGYSKDLISEALGHSYGNQVTSIYLREDSWQKIDEMNLEIVKLIKRS